MSAQLIQAPASKVWHIGVLLPSGIRLPSGRRRLGGRWKPICSPASEALWRIRSSLGPSLDIEWRTPHGICTNCAREVESAVRLIAVEESRNA